MKKLNIYKEDRKRKKKTLEQILDEMESKRSGKEWASLRYLPKDTDNYG